MKFALSVAMIPPNEYLPVAMAAEAAGWDSIAVPDSVFFPEKVSAPYPYVPGGERFWSAETPYLDPWVAIPAMAAVTTRIKLYTSVLKLPIRHPLLVAKTVGSAAALSGNRVGLGVGLSWIPEEFTWCNTEYATRGERVDEAIDIIRALLAGGMVEWHGKHYQFERLQMTPAPTAPVPIYVGGHSEPALKRAARLGDGWTAAMITQSETKKIIDRLRVLREEHGRSHLPFEIQVSSIDTFDADGYRRLEDIGVTEVITQPWMLYTGPMATLDEKKASIERFAREVFPGVKRDLQRRLAHRFLGFGKQEWRLPELGAEVLDRPPHWLPSQQAAHECPLPGEVDEQEASHDRQDALPGDAGNAHERARADERETQGVLRRHERPARFGSARLEVVPRQQHHHRDHGGGRQEQRAHGHGDSQPESVGVRQEERVHRSSTMGPRAPVRKAWAGGRRALGRGILSEIMFLRAEEARLFAEIVRTLPLAAAVFDLEMTCLACNDGWLAAHGYHDDRSIVGRVHYDVFPEIRDEWRAIHRRCLAGATERNELDVFEHPDGRKEYLRWVVAPWRVSDGAVGGIVIFTENVTAAVETKKRLQEEQLKAIHTSKLATLGEMAAGVAHEINTPLSLIGGASYLVRDALAAGDMVEAERQIASIDDAVERGARIVRGLAKFSRRGGDDPPGELAIDTVVNDALDLCRARIGSHGVVVTAQVSSHARVVGHEVELSQVLVNLLNNAFDAARTSQTRWIRIAAEDVGPTVTIAVEDSGPRLSPEHAAQVFTPFFTTKKVGAGTGLGLSISRSIAESHGGTLTYDASAACTRFVLSLQAVP